MTRKFAQHTSVPAERSRAELESILKRYGSDQFSSGWTAQKIVIMFRLKNRYIKIEMPMPVLEKPTSSYYRKKELFYSEDAVAQETRRRWRAMILYVKAKLESVECNIVSFEQAFMAHIVLPNKQTVSEFMQPQIEAAYSNGQMPLALPGY